jgi:tetratricopeptide (TPR) repeat protein
MKGAREMPETCHTAEHFLQRAVGARSAVTRARYARQGLASRAPMDRTTQSLLLRQLYLAHFEQQQFLRAFEIGQQMLSLRVMPDVCHHDLARVMVLLGDIDGAVGHLRLAARSAPARRRAFHLWTLGSVLYVAGRLELAHGALVRALRWSTTDRPLVAAQLALVRLARCESVDDLHRVIEQLQAAPCGQGYGRFVLGMLCAHAGRLDEAQRYLRNFVQRTRAARPAVAIALDAELQLAESRLSALHMN